MKAATKPAPATPARASERCPDCTSQTCRIVTRIAELDGTETIVRHHGDAPDLRKRTDIFCVDCSLMKVATLGARCPGCEIKKAEREDGQRKQEENQKRFVEFIKEKKHKKSTPLPTMPTNAPKWLQEPPTSSTREFCADGKQTAATLRKHMQREGYKEKTIEKQVKRAIVARLITE